MLSIIIPTLNAEAHLPSCLAAIGEAQGAEILIVDGGSTDGTLGLAARRGVRVEAAPRGRGSQLRAGARLANRPWLLFLHADTRLQAGWFDEVRPWVLQPTSLDRAATFSFALDDANLAARLLEQFVAARVRLLSLPYGDQGLLIHRTLYDRIGGYGPLPLMEDVDLVRRIGRGRLSCLGVSAVTSASRWRRDGWLRRSAKNLTCLALFQLGVAPGRILRFYEH